MTWTTRLRSEAGSLAFITAGKGPRLLMIHGVGLRAEAWNAQIAALSDRFEILAPDLPGHGGSAALSGAPDLKDYSDRIARLLDRPSIVVGHSMGAMIALDLASRYQDQVRGVGALNAIFRRSLAARTAVRKRATELDGIATVDPSAALDRWFGIEPGPERQACHDWLSSVDPAGYRTAYSVFAKEDGPDEADLMAISCPALFMTGGLEPNSTPAMSRAMTDLAPHGVVNVVEDAAHMMPMTHPAAVNRALLDFAEGCQP
ncbi:alpha/beta hydrolase [uncultured Roseibium sp.]|uniref:alpha/beta fold hydrolase n=1 Tax=uncultured Roseibium sp. TaxID=1936171 RepID=UPI00260C2BBB|nr:alpha/beta hydrolase [uncultured Roseibium sp.]